MQADIAEESLIRFDGFELALKSGELRKGGSLVKLQPQPFKVLAFLVAHAGQLVTREEIQQRIWEGETFVDFEHGLNFCIKQIRAALGDSAQSPRYIETLPRRGYRFIAPVEKLDRAPQLPDDRAPVVSETNLQMNPAAATRLEPVARADSQFFARPFIRSRLLKAALIALVAAIAVSASFVWRSFEKQARPPHGKILMVVLPFENLTADAEQDYFSDGLTEEMIAQLGRLHPQRLGVIARTSAMTYKDANKDIHRIGQELGVDYVLEGSVRREGDRLRITAQLIQVSDQTHLWAESYDRAQSAALAVQSEVAGRIARSLALELLPARDDRASSYTPRPEAHDAYLKGRYLWNKASVENLKKSVEYFHEAIEKDPQYARGYVGLADSYRLLGIFHAMLPRDAFGTVKEAALKALELDERLAEAHTALGAVKFWFEWNWMDAEKEFKRAIEINPSYGLARHDYAWFLVSQQRFDEGLAEIKRAQELDPLSPLTNADVGWVYLRARRYDEAIEQIKRTLELEPNFGSAHACLERAYMGKGMYREALASARAEMARSGASVQELAALDKTDVMEAIKRVERWRLNKRMEAAQKRRVSPYGFAMHYAALGEKDRAFEWLEKAFEERDHALVSLKVDPACDPLRTDPRFDELLRLVGL